MKLIHSSTSMKSALVYVYLIQAGYSKGWNPIQKFLHGQKKIIFVRQENIFQGPVKIL